MKRVTFQKVEINNFKGCRYLEVDFSDNTIVRGMNRTGKTTLFDALVWVLFGKNSMNRSDFNIKNKVYTDLNRADHSVELTMLVDGNINTLKRVYREKWSKKRGEEFATYDSNETVYFWNNVPVTMREYNLRVSEVVEEKVFRMLTNPMFFNTMMSDDERREVITRMATDITDEKVINGTPAYRELMDRIKGQKSLNDYRKEISAEKTKLKTELSAIPARIDEIKRTTPPEQDWDAIQSEIDSVTGRLGEIDQWIAGQNDLVADYNRQVEALVGEQLKARQEMNQMETAYQLNEAREIALHNAKIDQANREIPAVKASILLDNDRITAIRLKLGEIQQRIFDLRDVFKAKNAEVFSFSREGHKCGFCGSPLPEGKIDEEMVKQQEYFNMRKLEELGKINHEGQHLSKTKQEYEAEIKLLEDGLVRKNELLQELIATSMTERMSARDDVKALMMEREDYRVNMGIANRPIPERKVIDLSKMKAEKDLLNARHTELVTAITGRSLRNTLMDRTQELLKKEQEYSSKLAELERTEFTIESFMKKRMDMIEKSVNDKFKFISFMLFDPQVNGGERQVFKVMVNGVPYSDVNRADQINAGIDVINALSNHFGISAPIIIDNAEAVNEFLPTESQTIRLYVTEDQVLTIN